MTTFHMEIIRVPHAGTTISETSNIQKIFGLSMKETERGVANYSQKGFARLLFRPLGKIISVTILMECWRKFDENWTQSGQKCQSFV